MARSPRSFYIRGHVTGQSRRQTWQHESGVVGTRFTTLFFHDDHASDFPVRFHHGEIRSAIRTRTRRAENGYYFFVEGPRNRS